MSTKLLGLLLVLGFVALSEQDETAPRVKTPLGAIKGSYRISANGRQYEAYEGVPYALPPIGKLRFKAPHKLPPWTGELPATKMPGICMQYDQIPVDRDERVVGMEDCLYLNIYVPVREETSNPLPVFFWIHSGAFMFGTGATMGPKYLMDRDVIFVAINYRLGPLGFLSTEDEIVPGNNGLKDQNMALRWVYDNIEWFGGNPKKITLGGLSAGGASVHYHYMSPMSAGLFQGGISVSGASFECWPQTENAAERAKKLGAILGCPTTCNKEMIRCLRYRPARAVVQATEHFMPWFYNPFTPFGPVPERAGDNPFIDRSPAEIVASGDVTDAPWVTGVVKEEGLYPVAEFCADRKNLIDLDNNWDLIAPHFLDYNYTLPREKHVEVGRLIKKHYFGTKKIDDDTLPALIKLASDRFFITDSAKAAVQQAKANKKPVWYYYYTFRGTHSLSETMSRGSTRDFGVSHGDDALLVLDTPYIAPPESAADYQMQKELLDFWMSFITDGVPRVRVKWPSIDPSQNDLQYMHISGPGKYKMETDANFGEQDFWKSLGLNENVVRRTSDTSRDEF